MSVEFDYNIKWIGDEHILIFFPQAIPNLSYRLGLRETLMESGYFDEVVLGIEDVCVRYDGLIYDQKNITEKLKKILLKSYNYKSEEPLIEIPVCYEDEYGLDLDFLSQELSLSKEEIIHHHISGDYIIEAIGFLPGFAYCGPLSRKLNLLRREQPRQLLPAGAIAIANNQTGIYSLPSPGGWHVVGQTPLSLFNTKEEKPFSLKVGQSIKFQRISSEQFTAHVNGAAS